MNGRSTQRVLAMGLATGGLLLAANASAQDASATTRSLNTAPAQTTLAPRPNAQPPLTASEPPRPRDRTLEDLLGTTRDDAEPPTERPSGVVLAEGETEPAPIPMTLGYYVRGEMDCNEVWPGDGDLAWVTPTSFTIDFGGCEPGPWQQTGPNSWREEQRCVTESGGNAGGYSVTYEVIGTDAINRSALLALDGSVEQDVWNFCRPEDVPENARFGAQAPTVSNTG